MQKLILSFLFLLLATPAFAENAVLTWIDNSGNNPAVNDQETGFQIERNLNGGVFGLITTTAVNVQTFTDTTLVADNTVDNRYCYRVRAVNAAGVSAWATTATPGVTDCKVVPKRILVIPAGPTGLLVK